MNQLALMEPWDICALRNTPDGFLVSLLSDIRGEVEGIGMVICQLIKLFEAPRLRQIEVLLEGSKENNVLPNEGS